LLPDRAESSSRVESAGSATERKCWDSA